MLKKFLMISFLFIFSFHVNSQEEVNSLNIHSSKENSVIAHIKLSFNKKEIIIELFDNPINQELLSRLPLNLDFSDFSKEEKIAYLSQALNTKFKIKEKIGDFAYYAPWGNLALFYNGKVKGSNSLFILGNIQSGKENLIGIENNFKGYLEQID